MIWLKRSRVEVYLKHLCVALPRTVSHRGAGPLDAVGLEAESLVVVVVLGLGLLFALGRGPFALASGRLGRGPLLPRKAVGFGPVAVRVVAVVALGAYEGADSAPNSDQRPKRRGEALEDSHPRRRARCRGAP